MSNYRSLLIVIVVLACKPLHESDVKDLVSVSAGERRVEIIVDTTPRDDPDETSPAHFEVWRCSAYTQALKNAFEPRKDIKRVPDVAENLVVFKSESQLKQADLNSRHRTFAKKQRALHQERDNRNCYLDLRFDRTTLLKYIEFRDNKRFARLRKYIDWKRAHYTHLYEEALRVLSAEDRISRNATEPNVTFAQNVMRDAQLAISIQAAENDAVLSRHRQSTRKTLREKQEPTFVDWMLGFEPVEYRETTSADQSRIAYTQAFNAGESGIREMNAILVAQKSRNIRWVEDAAANVKALKTRLTLALYELKDLESCYERMKKSQSSWLFNALATETNLKYSQSLESPKEVQDHFTVLAGTCSFQINREMRRLAIHEAAILFSQPKNPPPWYKDSLVPVNFRTKVDGFLATRPNLSLLLLSDSETNVRFPHENSARARTEKANFVKEYLQKENYFAYLLEFVDFAKAYPQAFMKDWGKKDWLKKVSQHYTAAFNTEDGQVDMTNDFKRAERAILSAPRILAEWKRGNVEIARKFFDRESEKVEMTLSLATEALLDLGTESVTKSGGAVKNALFILEQISSADPSYTARAKDLRARAYAFFAEQAERFAKTLAYSCEIIKHIPVLFDAAVAKLAKSTNHDVPAFQKLLTHYNCRVNRWSMVECKLPKDLKCQRTDLLLGRLYDSAER